MKPVVTVGKYLVWLPPYIKAFFCQYDVFSLLVSYTTRTACVIIPWIPEDHRTSSVSGSTADNALLKERESPLSRCYGVSAEFSLSWYVYLDSALYNSFFKALKDKWWARAKLKVGWNLRLFEYMEKLQL